MTWEEFVDQLRPLGARMKERLPQRLRDDPQTLAEARSEEHTSELQSRLGISYAVFCLEKKSTRLNSSHV